MTKKTVARVTRSAPKKRARAEPGEIQAIGPGKAFVSTALFPGEDPVLVLALGKSADALAHLRCDVRMMCDEFTVASGGVLVSEIRIRHAFHTEMLDDGREEIRHRYVVGVSVDIEPALKKRGA